MDANEILAQIAGINRAINELDIAIADLDRSMIKANRFFDDTESNILHLERYYEGRVRDVGNAIYNFNNRLEQIYDDIDYVFDDSFKNRPDFLRWLSENHRDKYLEIIEEDARRILEGLWHGEIAWAEILNRLPLDITSAESWALARLLIRMENYGTTDRLLQRISDSIGNGKDAVTKIKEILSFLEVEKQRLNDLMTPLHPSHYSYIALQLQVSRVSNLRRKLAAVGGLRYEDGNFKGSPIVLNDPYSGRPVLARYSIEKLGGTIVFNERTNHVIIRLNNQVIRFSADTIINDRVVLNTAVLAEAFNMPEQAFWHQTHDAFNSATDAAAAHLLMTQTKTHRYNVEFGSVINRVQHGEQYFYYFTTFRRGGHANVVWNLISGYMAPYHGNISRIRIGDEHQLVSGSGTVSFVHTHPPCTCHDGSGFSRWDKRVVDLPWFPQIQSMYVGKPNGEMLRYDDNITTPVTTNLPSTTEIFPDGRRRPL